MNSLILCIDFDGTITYNDARFPKIGSLRSYAKYIMDKIKERGHKIIISTCRCGMANVDARLFCDKNKIPYDAWCMNLPERIAQYGGRDPRKISADIYLDDKALGIKTLDVKTWVSLFNEVIKMENSEEQPKDILDFNFISALELWRTDGCNTRQNV